MWMLFFRAEADGCNHFHFSNIPGYVQKLFCQTSLMTDQIERLQQRQANFPIFTEKRQLKQLFLSSLFLVVNPHFFGPLINLKTVFRIIINMESFMKKLDGLHCLKAMITLQQLSVSLSLGKCHCTKVTAKFAKFALSLEELFLFLSQSSLKVSKQGVIKVDCKFINS